MSAAARPDSSIGTYGVAVIAALLMHAVIFWVFSGGLDMQFHKPKKEWEVNKVISASLVVVKPKKVKPKKNTVKKKTPSTPKKVAAKPKAKVTEKASRPVKKDSSQAKELKEAIKPADSKNLATERTLSEDLLSEEDQILEQEQEQSEREHYSQLMSGLVEQYWSRPPSARNGMKVVLSIELLPTGDVISVRIKQGSGNNAFDRSAILAVEKIGRFDELQSMPIKLFDKYFRKIDLMFKPEDLRL